VSALESIAAAEQRRGPLLPDESEHPSKLGQRSSSKNRAGFFPQSIDEIVAYEFANLRLIESAISFYSRLYF
jgi:hypothetical protein